MKLAVISDIHADLPSLEKAIKNIRRSGCDRILCLGDIVGYSYHYADHLEGRDPNACIRVVNENCDDVICGNHDLHAILKLPVNHMDLGMPSNWYDLDLGERTRISDQRFWLYDDELEDAIDDESRDYLAQLPETKIIKGGRINILATHFIYPDITGCMQASPSSLKDFKNHLKLVKRNKCQVGLAGHAHLEGYAQVSRKVFAMNYFQKAQLMRCTQVIVVPAITRGKSRNGYLVLDTEKRNFETIALG